MTKRREKIVELAGRIADLKRKVEGLKREIYGLESELDALLPDDDVSKPKKKKRSKSTTSATKKVFAQKGDVVPGSIPDGVLKIVDPHPESVFKTSAFHHLGSIGSVRSALHRMVGAGQLKKVSRGEYQSAQKMEG